MYVDSWGRLLVKVCFKCSKTDISDAKGIE